MIFMVCLEEKLDLLGKESKQFLSGLGYHQLPRDGNLRVREAECGISMKVNGADSEIGSSKIDREIESLCMSARVWLSE